ncbi:hypothetical protein [Actinacidiphila oryziradicis]|uniref:Uncharacterized protein n=1 Tax=Actinacidiphila oryziradicis TaxID=2571141 RepID=A0A4U0RG03_9ACTN|nr:hypothetical protein [Actinacidiphila oryziradicis]TJZ94451.1 hypothetical protein FCI23_53680 [Actinacidiphila oryziradicis]
MSKRRTQQTVTEPEPTQPQPFFELRVAGVHITIQHAPARLPSLAVGALVTAVASYGAHWALH